MMGWQWHQLDHMQIICTLLQTDNHASISPLSFYRLAALPSAQPTVSKHWKPNDLKKHSIFVLHQCHKWTTFFMLCSLLMRLRKLFCRSDSEITSLATRRHRNAEYVTHAFCKTDAHEHVMAIFTLQSCYNTNILCGCRYTALIH